MRRCGARRWRCTSLNSEPRRLADPHWRRHSQPARRRHSRTAQPAVRRFDFGQHNFELVESKLFCNEPSPRPRPVVPLTTHTSPHNTCVPPPPHNTCVPCPDDSKPDTYSGPDSSTSSSSPYSAVSTARRYRTNYPYCTAVYDRVHTNKLRARRPVPHGVMVEGYFPERIQSKPGGVIPQKGPKGDTDDHPDDHGRRGESTRARRSGAIRATCYTFESV